MSETRNTLRQVFSDVSLALLAYTGLVQLLAFFYNLPYVLGYTELYFNDWYYHLGSSVIVYPAGFLALGLGLGHLPAPRLRPQLRPGPRQILAGGAVSLGLMYLANLLTLALLEGTGTQDLLQDYMTDTPIPILVLSTVIIAPICEELIFRRLLLDRLLFLGDGAALLLSALFFGLFHTNLYQFFYAFAVGLALGYIRILTGSMKWPILVHMFINLFCGVLTEYFYESEVFLSLSSLVLVASIGYAISYLLRRKPWRELYPGPLPIPAREKAAACLTSPAFWACLLLHLGLSVYYILPASY